MIREQKKTLSAPNGKSYQKVSSTSILTQHYFGIHPKSYQTKPENKEMGILTNWFKHKGYALRRNINELFEAAGKGKTLLPANYEVDTNPDSGQLGIMRFVSSSLILIDVDDDNYLTDPDTLVTQLKGTCCGYFYTFSNGIKGQRYRLVFQLDEPIRNYELYKGVVQELAYDIEKLIHIPEGAKSPIDTQPKNALLPVRTGKETPVIYDLTAHLPTQEYIKYAKREQQKRLEKVKESFKSVMHYRYTVEDLKDMAHKIGYIPSGAGRGDEWKTVIVGLRHYVNTGVISIDEGYEIADIVCGGELSYKNWSNMRADGKATIGSFIKAAKDNGYKLNRYSYGLQKTKTSYPTEEHKIKKHIPADLAKELISRKQKILVDSATGSGKSTAFIKGSLELVKENPESKRIYVFAAPTIALTKQLANNHSVPAVLGGSGHLSKALAAHKKGARVFVCTYDMSQTFVSKVKEADPLATYVLIVDEYHKMVTDYESSYRLSALRRLASLIPGAISFIALSGTTNDILKDIFDKVIKINNNKEGSPCQDFAVYTYPKRNDALPSLMQLIESWTSSKRRLLIYIQSKEVIGKIANLLQRKGIVAKVISAADTKSPLYKTIVETEKIPEEVQVVLATSVIADGVSIQNSLDWECLVVANHFSDLFNPSLLKQISNRFRQEYRRFSVFMQQPLNQETDLFNIDAAYQYVFKVSSSFAEKLNDEFVGKDLELFKKSIAERKYGLNATAEGVTVDVNHLRHNVSKVQERYYRSRRQAFINAVEKILHKKSIGMLDIKQALEENQLDLTPIEQSITELNQQIKDEREARKHGLESYFTQDIYELIQENQLDCETYEKFETVVLPEQISCIKKLVNIADFETCKKVALTVTKKANTHNFYKRIDALISIWLYNSISRDTITKPIFKDLLKLTAGKVLEVGNTNDDKEKELVMILKSVARKRKVDLDTVTKVKNTFFYKIDSRKEKQRFTQLFPITFESVAEEFQLDFSQLQKTIENYSKSHTKAIQRVVMKRLAEIENPQLDLLID